LVDPILSGRPRGRRYNSIFNRLWDIPRLVEERRYGIRDEPIRLFNWYHAKAYEYDDRGNKTAIAYFGPDGKPALGPDLDNKQLCTRWTGKYDDKGKVVSQQCEALSTRRASR